MEKDRLIEESVRFVEDWFGRYDEAGAVKRLKDLVDINTHTFNTAGIEQAFARIESWLRPLHADQEHIALDPYEFIDDQGCLSKRPLAASRLWRKRHEKAGINVLLMIHVDTVFEPHVVFPFVEKSDRLCGPGVGDAKAGILILIEALRCYEAWRGEKRVNWTVFINSDEEIGSPSSRSVIPRLAGEHACALVFEPCLGRDCFAGARKGSGNFTLVVKGKSAHAGRNPQQGRNAVLFLADCLMRLYKRLHGKRPGLTVNIGAVHGGAGFNVVPDTAVGRFNIRIERDEDEAFVWVEIKRTLSMYRGLRHLSMTLYGSFGAPPKFIDEKTRRLFKEFKQCAKRVGRSLRWAATGGVCDGNRLARYGCPNLDTCGAVGGGWHTTAEYIIKNSLRDQAKLTALWLIWSSVHESRGA